MTTRYLRDVNGFLRKIIVSTLILGSYDHAMGQNKESDDRVPNPLVVGTTQETDTLHPALTGMAASSFVRTMTLRPIMWGNEKLFNECLLCEGLPSLTNGNVKIVKEKDKKGRSVEKMLVTWKLKPGITWGDGTPVTGEDFKLAWEIGSSARVSVLNSDSFRAIEDVKVDSRDPLTMTLKYAEIRYDYESIELIVPIPSHLERPIYEQTKNQIGAYEKKTLYNTNPTHPGLYNGPYRVKEFKPGAHILLEQNPKYWGAKGVFPQIIYKLIPNTQTLEAEFKIGSVHLTAHTGVSMDQALQFEKQQERDPKLAQQFKVTYGRIPSYEKIDFNFDDPIVSDVRVRQALALGLDRHRLNKALFSGKQEVADQIFNPLSPYYAPNLPPMDYNPEKSKKILDEAGWKMGPNGFRQKDGKTLSLLMMTTSQNKLRELIQTYAQEEWRKIGVQVQFKNEPARVFFGDTMKKRSYGAMALYGWSEDIPNQVPIHIYHSKYIPRKENHFTGYNRTGVVSKEMDTCLDRAATTLDVVERGKIMQEFAKIFRDLVVELPISYRKIPFLVRRELSTPTSDDYGYPVGMRVENWEWNVSTQK
jgi:peptide/nickel transport system substrate-binding protein